MVGHTDGGHVLFGADLHELLNFAGSVEEGIVRVVRVVVDVDEGGLGHGFRFRAGRQLSSLKSGGVVPF